MKLIYIKVIDLIQPYHWLHAIHKY